MEQSERMTHWRMKKKKNTKVKQNFNFNWRCELNTHAGKPIVVWMLCQRLETLVMLLLFYFKHRRLWWIRFYPCLIYAMPLFYQKKKKEVNKVFIPNIFFDWKVYLFFNWLKVNKNIIVPRKWGFEKFYTSKKEKEGGKTNPKTLWIWTLFIYCI